ncbi:MAG: UvrD-helicase domain-containing protein [Candidatus Margulisiibacteriota bacterium]
MRNPSVEIERHKYPVNLNSQQLAAVQHYGTPQVIIAGAGTGKTTVMISKIFHLIETQKHTPNEILALTFTNKAANEMKERFHAKRQGNQSPTFATFHSFCLRFLKQTSALIEFGYQKEFSIIDAQQQKELITLIQKNTPSLGRKPKEVLSKISQIKQHPHHMHSQLLASAPSDIQAAFEPYNQRLREMNCMDFDDLLLITYKILATDARTLANLQSQYKYIIVDEYQDTNQIQNDITILMAKAHTNICVVGDFDQTIYSWRGAKVENLMMFHQVFPSTTVQKLEINYRSTQEILGAANQLIEYNSNRQDKRLISDRTSQQAPQHIICYDEREEAEYIARKIKKLIEKNQYNGSDFAILYRTNQQSRAIEECLTHHNIPHHIVGTTAFYQRVEVKVAIAYLHCLNNINQPVWLEKALLTPSRGIGKTSLQKLINFSLETNTNIEQAIASPDCPLQNRFIEIVRNFIAKLNEINQQEISIEAKLDAIFEHVQFERYLRKLENHQDRMANLQELKSKLKETENLATFLDDITLFQGSDEDTSVGKVRCLTLHLAKGLEFPIVFIPGFEDGIMPIRNTESLEEERRLGYVGITRGKDQVYLLSTYKRTLIGEDWYNNISTFTKELAGKITIKLTDQAHHIGKAMVFKLQNENLKFSVIQSQKGKKTVISAAQTNFKIYEVGDVIFHQTLGTGTVNGVSGLGDMTMYEIQFSSGKKKLMAKFAKLQKSKV